MTGDPLLPGSGQAPHLLLKTRDAAETLQIAERTLFDLTKRGLIPVVRIGRSVRYDLRDLAKFIDANKKGAS